MKNYILIFAVFNLFLSVGCNSAKPVATNDRSEIKSVVNNPQTMLVDVRIPEEFAEATAEGAVNIPLAEIQNNIDFFKQQKQTVVFCNRGRQAAQAIEILKKNGVTNVYNGATWKNVKAIKQEK